MKLVISFSVLLISSFVQEGVSVKCFECRSDIDPKCADPFDNSTIRITDCKHPADELTVDPTRCRKASKKENGEWITFRSCGLRTDPDVQDDEQVCMTKSGPDGLSEELCMCKVKDGCNTSSTIKSIQLLLIGPIFFVVISNLI